jgi:hypothetical protein
MCPFLAWEDYHNFYLALQAPLVFREADVHKNKCRETRRKSHDDSNITDENVGMTESFSASTELPNACAGILIFLKFLFLVVLGLELRATPWATPPALFCDEYF